MNRIARFSFITSMNLLFLSACDNSVSPLADKNHGSINYPEYDQPQLQLGRSIWLENCQACHGTGLAGAPLIGNKQQWRARIAKDTSVLYQHALNGFEGVSGTEMPARGGNDALTDKQVKAAVDYMLKVSE